MTISDVFDAVREGTYEEFLKWYDGNVNQIDKYTNLNLLEMAVVNDKQMQEKIKIIDYLLEHGININFVDSKNKRNALHQFFFSVNRAEKEYYLMITERLVKAGIDINAEDKFNAIPLKYAITVNKLTTGDMEEVYKYLLKNGSSYAHTDVFGKSCIDYANEYSWRTGFIDIVKEMQNDK